MKLFTEAFDNRAKPKIHVELRSSRKSLELCCTWRFDSTGHSPFNHILYGPLQFNSECELKCDTIWLFVAWNEGKQKTKVESLFPSGERRRKVIKQEQQQTWRCSITRPSACSHRFETAREKRAGICDVIYPLVDSMFDFIHRQEIIKNGKSRKAESVKWNFKRLSLSSPRSRKKEESLCRLSNNKTRIFKAQEISYLNSDDIGTGRVDAKFQ